MASSNSCLYAWRSEFVHLKIALVHLVCPLPNSRLCAWRTEFGYLVPVRIVAVVCSAYLIPSDSCLCAWRIDIVYIVPVKIVAVVQFNYITHGVPVPGCEAVQET